LRLCAGRSAGTWGEARRRVRSRRECRRVEEQPAVPGA